MDKLIGRFHGYAKPLLAAAMLALAGVAAAQFQASSEYLSVAGKKANVRAEPRKGAKIKWVMWKFFPVEVVSYRREWIRIRDFEGDEGWMHKSTLTDVPCVQTKTKAAKLRKTPNGRVLWILDRGYSFRVFGARGDWLEVSDLGSASGWIHRSAVWGAPAPGS